MPPAAVIHAWLDRAASKRALEDEVLTERIRSIHARSCGTYGAPRTHAELRAKGTLVGRKRVARLMRAAGLAGVSRRRGCVTTIRDSNRRQAPDLVERNFEANAPDALWVADITYIPTWVGFLYLAVVLDAWS
jgi:putative transposase